MKTKTIKKKSVKDKKIADLEFIIRIQEKVIDHYDSSLADTSTRFIEYAKAFWNNQCVHESEKEDWTKQYNEIVRAYNGLAELGKFADELGIDIRKHRKNLPESKDYEFSQDSKLLESGKVQHIFKLKKKPIKRKGTKDD
jgi:hypothetical protein|tara:strand:+ start:195 stop:614 length:420 start_codon:yes stop_codon:yes gene_type:complete